MAIDTTIPGGASDLMAILFGPFNGSAFTKSRLIDFDKMQAARRRERGEKIVRAEHGENVNKVFSVLSSDGQYWSVYSLAKQTDLSEKAVHGALRKLFIRELIKKKSVNNGDGKVYRYYRLKKQGEA